MSAVETSTESEVFNVARDALAMALGSENNDNISFYPTILDLAVMSQHSYYKYSEKKLPLDGTVKIFTAKGEDGYKATAFLNAEKRQLVISHGGTENSKDYLADASGVGFERLTAQNKSAYVFSAFVIQRYVRHVLSISLTGQSLGGWLAQTTALLLKDPEVARNNKVSEAVGLEIYYIVKKKKTLVKNEKVQEIMLNDMASVHVHVVSFDSPGCRHVITKCYANNEKSQAVGQEMIRKLDIKIYLSLPNFVNSCALHVGRLFSLYELVEVKKLDLKEGPLATWFVNLLKKWHINTVVEYAKNCTYTKQVHGIGSIVETIKKLKEIDSSVYEILDWGHTLNSSVKFNQHRNTSKYKTRMPHLETLPLSIFDDKEINFLLTISILHKAKRYRNIFNEHAKILDKIKKECLSFDVPLESLGTTKIAFDIEILNGGLSPKNFVSFWKCWMTLNRSDVLHFQNASSYVALYGKPAEYMQLARMVQTNDVNCFGSSNTDIEELKSFLLNKEEVRGELVINFDPNGNSFQATAQVYAIIKALIETEGSIDILCVNFNILNEMAKNQISVFREKNNFPTLYIVEKQETETKVEIKETIDEFNMSKSRKIIFVRKATPIKHFAVSGRISFDNLSVDGKRDILNAKVNFQGVVVTLNDILENRLTNETGLRDIFALEMFPNFVENPDVFGKIFATGNPQITVGEPVPDFTMLLDDVSKYYMKRTFCKNVLKISNDFFVDQNSMPPDYPGYYLISGDISITDVASKLKINSKLVDSVTFSAHFTPPEGKNVFVTPESNDELVQEIELQKYEFHWFKYDSKVGFVWQASSLNSGKTSELPKVLPNDEFYSEEDMINSSNRVVILGDEAGNGKSTMMVRFANEAKNSQSWIIFTSLASISEPLFQHFRGKIDLANIAQFFAVFDSAIPHAELGLRVSILKALLREKNKVTFLFDGYDEIPPKVQSIVIQISQVIISETKAKLRISSRFYTQSELEKSLNALAFKMNPLTESQRVEFLGKFWRAQSDFIENNVIVEDAIVEAFAMIVLDEISNHLKDEDVINVLGIPLLMYMAGKVSFKRFLEHVSSRSSNNKVMFTSILDLYRKFVQSSFDRALEKKFVQGSYLEWHHKAAFHYLCPSFIIDNVHNNALDMFRYVDDTMLAFLSQIGLLQTHGINIKFLHRSIAEYFTAEFLVSNLNRKFEKTRESTLQFLKLNFFIKSFDKIRYFMDHMMADKIPKLGDTNIFIDALCGRVGGNGTESVFDILLTDESKDLLDRVPVSYFMAYNFPLLKHDISAKRPNIEWEVYLDSLGQNPLVYASLDIMVAVDGDVEVFDKESVWKMCWVSSLRGNYHLTSSCLRFLRPHISREGNCEEAVLKAIKFASFFKTDQHARCILFVMYEVATILNDLGIYKHLIGAYPDFMHHIPIAFEIIIWLCCDEYVERKNVFKFLVGKYNSLKSNNLNIAGFIYLRDDLEKALKIIETQKIVEIPSNTIEGEYELLTLIQCILMTTSFCKTYRQSSSITLYFAFIIRIFMLTPNLDHTIDHNLLANRIRVPVKKALGIDSSVMANPYLVLENTNPPMMFEIPFVDKNCRMVINGSLYLRLSHISFKSFLFNIFDQHNIDIFVLKDKTWNRLDGKEATDFFSGEPRDDKSKLKSIANFWISNDEGLTVTELDVSGKVLISDDNNQYATFQAILGGILLNNAKFFALNKN